MNEIRLADFRAESLQFDTITTSSPRRTRTSPFPSNWISACAERHAQGPDVPQHPRHRVRRRREQQLSFEIIADVTGVFFIEAEGADREAILKDNGMIMLLPYVRAMISQLVSLANLPTPVILPPMDPSQMKPMEQPAANS